MSSCSSTCESSTTSEHTVIEHGVALEDSHQQAQSGSAEIAPLCVNLTEVTFVCQNRNPCLTCAIVAAAALCGPAASSLAAQRLNVDRDWVPGLIRAFLLQAGSNLCHLHHSTLVSCNLVPTAGSVCVPVVVCGTIFLIMSVLCLNRHASSHVGVQLANIFVMVLPSWSIVQFTVCCFGRLLSQPACVCLLVCLAS